MPKHQPRITAISPTQVLLQLGNQTAIQTGPDADRIARVMASELRSAGYKPVITDSSRPASPKPFTPLGGSQVEGGAGSPSATPETTE